MRKLLGCAELFSEESVAVFARFSVILLVKIRLRSALGDFCTEAFGLC